MSQFACQVERWYNILAFTLASGGEIIAGKILVVDDEPNLIIALTRSLELEGYQVVSASDGQEALQAFYSERPDLLILDVMMPGMDGWQVCQRVREMSEYRWRYVPCRRR